MERTFDLRMPKLAEAKHGLEFTDDPRNWVQMKGSVAEFITAMYPENSEAGIHASNGSGRTSSVSFGHRRNSPPCGVVH